MSSEQIRLILTEVEKFLSETLKKESKLSKKTVEQKQNLLDKLQKFYEENPQLKPVPSQDSISAPDESSTTGGTDGSSRSDGSEDVNYNDAGIGLIASADLKSPVYSGFLEKKQKKGAGLFGGTKFQRRWCVVQAGIFYYYTNQKDKQQNGSFMVEGYKFRNAPDLSSKKAEKELCFELYQDNDVKRAYQFMAKTKTEYDEWENVIAAGGHPLIEEDIYEEVGEELRSREVDIKVEEPGEEYEDPDSVNLPRPPPPPSPMSIQKPMPPPPVEVASKPVPNEVVETADDVYDDAFSPESKTEDLPPPIHSKPPHVEVPLPPVPEVPPSFKKRPQRNLPPPPPEKKRIKIKLPFKPQEDFENRFFGKWDCSGDSANELTFKKGDILHVLSMDFDEKSWWVAELDGKFGLVPKNFLTPAYTPVA